MGGGDVDDIDRVVGDQLLIRSVAASDGVPLSELGGTVSIASCDSHDLVTVGEADVVGQLLSDPAGAQDAPPDRSSRPSCLP